jgi:hypothetical protein
MIVIEVLMYLLISFILLFYLKRALGFLSTKPADMNSNYRKLTNYRLSAYKQLNNALANASIALNDTDIIHHNLFFCANDYFNYKKSLSMANKKSFWFSDNTAACLNAYLEILDEKGIIYGLSITSDEVLFQEFSHINYETFEYYQRKLLKSIMSDTNMPEDIEIFLDAKKQNIDIVNFNERVEMHLEK